MKLWDTRMLVAAHPGQHKTFDRLTTGYDYRFDEYPYADQPDEQPAHPDDNSVMTFRGHKVMRTLIRCHFSPDSTGQR